jgi:hypothetical protein
MDRQRLLGNIGEWPSGDGLEIVREGQAESKLGNRD